MIKTELPIVSNKRSLITALLLLFALIALSIQYPGPHNNADVILEWLGIPLFSRPQSQTGLHYSGIFTLAIFIAMFTFFYRALSRHRILVFFSVFMLLNFVPGWLVNGYQRVFASGVYAIELNPQTVRCTYVAKNQRLTGNCQIPMLNLSNAEVKAQPVLQIDLYYNNSPTKEPIVLPVLTLMPRTFDSFNVDFDVSLKQNIEISGQGRGFPITLSNGEQSRTWQ